MAILSSSDILWSSTKEMFFIASTSQWHILKNRSFMRTIDIARLRKNYLWLSDSFAGTRNEILSHLITSYKSRLAFIDKFRPTFNGSIRCIDRNHYEVNDEVVIYSEEMTDTTPCLSDRFYLLCDGSILEEYSRDSMVKTMLVFSEVAVKPYGNLFLELTHASVSLLMNTANSLSDAVEKPNQYTGYNHLDINQR